MKLFARLIGLFVGLWAVFSANAYMAVMFVHQAGFWRGLLACGLTSAAIVFLVSLTDEVIKTRRNSLPYLLNRYGKMVAENAKRRCRE